VAAVVPQYASVSIHLKQLVIAEQPKGNHSPQASNGSSPGEPFEEGHPYAVGSLSWPSYIGRRTRIVGLRSFASSFVIISLS
jgi:hypothetical protein